MNRIKLLLSSPLASRICLVVGLLSKIGLMRVYLNVGTDKAALLISTKNFLAGHGISIGRTFITDLADKTYMAYTGWPPGYTLLLSPFLSLFPDNFMLAAYCVDILAAIIFFVFLQKILRQLGFSPWLSALFLLFQGVFVNDYIVSSHPTDFLAMAFVVAGWYYCNLLFLKERKWVNHLLCILFFGFAALIRYQYMPVCVIGLLWAFYSGWVQQIKELKWSAVSISIGLIAITAITLLYQKHVSGDFLYQLPGVVPGWYPENITRTSPFALNSLIEINFWGVQLSTRTGTDYSWWINVFKTITAILVCFFAYTGWKWFRKKHQTSFSTVDAAWINGILLSSGLVLILVWLSVTHRPQTGTNWTFVMDGRYFAFVILFIQMFLWQKFFTNKKSKIVRSIITPFLFILYLFIGLHDTYILAKKTTQPVLPFDQILPAQPEMKIMLDFITEQRIKNPGRIICISGVDDQFGYFADWYGVNALFSSPVNLNMPHYASRPGILLVVFQKNRFAYYEKFLSQPGFSLYKEDDKWASYIVLFKLGKTAAP